MTMRSLFVAPALYACTAAAPALPDSSPAGHPGNVDTGEHPGRALFAAADVHYLPCGGARAAAVVAADTAFSRLADDRIAVVPDVARYQPDRWYVSRHAPSPDSNDCSPTRARSAGNGPAATRTLYRGAISRP
jgi:hypothetical protein